MIGLRQWLVYGALTIGAFRVASGQEWHMMDVSRQLRDTGGLHVHAEYSAGALDIRPGGDSVLFGMQLRYDGSNGRPLDSYDVASRSLTVGVSQQGVDLGHHMGGRNAGEMHLQLSRRIPLDLVLDLGAATANLDLGGLRLGDLLVHTGAAQATMAFSAPNPVPLSRFEIDVGAAALDATGLANANAPTIRVNAGVGSIDLTFDGTWTRDVSLDVSADLGKVTVRAPGDVGLWVEASNLIGAFEHADLVKRGNAWVSSNWDTAPFKLRVHATTILGEIDIEHSTQKPPPP